MRPDFHVWGTAKAGDGSLSGLIRDFADFAAALNGPARRRRDIRVAAR